MCRVRVESEVIGRFASQTSPFTVADSTFRAKPSEISIAISIDELFLGTSKINAIEGLDIHSIHKKLQDFKSDVRAENLDLLKTIIQL